MPTRVDLKGQVGNDEILKLTVTDSNDVAVNLDEPSIEILFVVKRYRSDLDEEAVLTFDEVAPEVSIVNGPEGRLDVQVTLDRPHWRYWWRLDVTQAGRDITALYGYLEMEPV